LNLYLGRQIARDDVTDNGTVINGRTTGEGRAVMKQPRAWQRMLSGRRLDLLDPTPVDIEIEDIAHGLAFVARWNGQTRGDWPYSVAEHSLLVEMIFSRANPGIATRWQLAALLHDAPEYVIGDMISPVKAAIGPDYGALDERLTAAVHLRFGLPATLPPAIKKAIKAADKISAWLEAVQIAGFSGEEADRFFGKPDALILRGLEIRLRPPPGVGAAECGRQEHKRAACTVQPPS
jgi:5'-deoxynucleotidase YfbR-like HD superfamily hydrolase